VPRASSSRYYITTPLVAGNVVSNEPGYYQDGAWGVRIENLVTIEEADTPVRFGGMSFFSFRALTLVPIQTKMVLPELMRQEEVAWLDDYHQRVSQQRPRDHQGAKGPPRGGIAGLEGAFARCTRHRKP